MIGMTFEIVCVWFLSYKLFRKRLKMTRDQAVIAIGYYFAAEFIASLIFAAGGIG